MPLQRRTRLSSLVEPLEERRLLAVALPSDIALAIDGTMAFGDINGDGKIDMVQATQAADSRTGVYGWGVDLYINRGSGQPAIGSAPGQLRQGPHLTAIPAGGFVFLGGNGSAVIGDVNGDGKNDIVVYFIQPGGVARRTPHGGVLLGDGKGGFKPGGTFDARGIASDDANWGMSLADFNGDKKKDLLVYTYTVAPPYNIATRMVTITSTVGIALNNGAGGFRDIVTGANPLLPILPPAPLPATAPAQGKYSYFRVLGAGDLDGNGRAEIVCQIDTDTIGFATPTAFGPITFNANKTITLPGAQAATGAQTTSSTTTQSALGSLLSPPAKQATALPVFGGLPKPGAATTALPAAKPAFAFLTDVNRDGLADIAALRGSVVYVGVNRSLQASLSLRPAIGWKQFSVAVPMSPLGPARNTTMMMFVGDMDGKGTQTMSFLVPGDIDLYAILGVKSLPPN